MNSKEISFDFKCTKVLMVQTVKIQVYDLYFIRSCFGVVTSYAFIHFITTFLCTIAWELVASSCGLCVKGWMHFGQSITQPHRENMRQITYSLFYSHLKTN